MAIMLIDLRSKWNDFVFYLRILYYITINISHANLNLIYKAY